MVDIAVIQQIRLVDAQETRAAELLFQLFQCVLSGAEFCGLLQRHQINVMANGKEIHDLHQLFGDDALVVQHKSGGLSAFGVVFTVRLYRIRQFLGEPFLPEKPKRLKLKRLKDKVAVTGNENQSCRRIHGSDLCGKFHAGHLRHINIQKQQLEFFLAVRLDQLRRIGVDKALELHALFFEQRLHHVTQTAHKNNFIITNCYPYHTHSPPGIIIPQILPKSKKKPAALPSRRNHGIIGCRQRH